MNYIAYNNLGIGKPTKWKLFSDGHEAYKYAMAMGDDWDMTNTDCFKEWFPNIDFTKD
jgi:hypothetical protein